jgi:hypothetical protein
MYGMYGGLGGATVFFDAPAVSSLVVATACDTFNRDNSVVNAALASLR